VIEHELEQFLGRLERALRGLRRRERLRALREARDHVLCAADERERSGQARGESLRAAIDAFGAVESVATGYVRPARTRRELARAGTVAVVAAVCALAFAPTGSRLGQLVIPTSHAAAADSGCSGRWNDDPAGSGYRLAWVSTAGPACEVVLHDARSARVFRQDARAGRWHAIVRSGRSLWAVERLPAALRTQPYTVGTDGRIGRRIG
jgi:hypothetical protein